MLVLEEEEEELPLLPARLLGVDRLAADLATLDDALVLDVGLDASDEALAGAEVPVLLLLADFEVLEVLLAEVEVGALFDELLSDDDLLELSVLAIVVS